MTVPVFAMICSGASPGLAGEILPLPGGPTAASQHLPQFGVRPHACARYVGAPGSVSSARWRRAPQPFVALIAHWIDDHTVSHYTCENGAGLCQQDRAGITFCRFLHPNRLVQPRPGKRPHPVRGPARYAKHLAVLIGQAGVEPQFD